MRVDPIRLTAPTAPGTAREFLMIAVSALLLVACGASPSSISIEGVPGSSNPIDAYRMSIYDSAVLDPANIRPLQAVPPEADPIVVVIWTTASTAERFYPIGTVSLGREVWVTLAPQVQTLCRAYPDDPAALRLRLQQLLGLPPRDEDRRFVVMAAPAGAIFRPCMDPDPTTSRCGTSFPDDVDAAHRNWIGAQMIDRYRVPPDGYPWTRLGYTYDWNPDSPKFGASEYILREGATVRVLRKAVTADYCHPA